MTAAARARLRDDPAFVEVSGREAVRRLGKSGVRVLVRLLRLASPTDDGLFTGPVVAADLATPPPGDRGAHYHVRTARAALRRLVLAGLVESRHAPDGSRRGRPARVFLLRASAAQRGCAWSSDGAFLLVPAGPWATWREAHNGPGRRAEYRQRIDGRDGVSSSKVIPKMPDERFRGVAPNNGSELAHHVITLSPDDVGSVTSGVSSKEKERRGAAASFSPGEDPDAVEDPTRVPAAPKVRLAPAIDPDDLPREGDPVGPLVLRCLRAYGAAVERAHGGRVFRKLRAGSRAWNVAAGAARELAREGVPPESWARFMIAFYRRYGIFGGAPPPMQAVFAAGSVRKRIGQYRAESLDHQPGLDDATRVPREDVEANLRRSEADARRRCGPGVDVLAMATFPEWYRELRRREIETSTGGRS